MGDLVRFVDAITAAPTVRLDLNDEVSFWVKKFSANPPRLRRSSSANAMRDGIFVGSATYDSRTLTLELEVRRAGQDASATDIQKLWRELDRESNWLMYQPNALTKPVFFRTYRSDASALEDVIAQAAMRTITVEVLAEPFALGLRETISVGVVTNNPTAAARGNFFDLTGVIGDVAAPATFIETAFTGGWTQNAYAARQHGTPSDLTWFKQAETMTLGTDTTNPGGGPDAAMSGAGANNFVRTSFATVATMTDRVAWDVAADHATSAKRSALSGTYRVLVGVRRSSATGNVSARFTIANVVTGKSTPIPASTSRQIVDLGLLSYDATDTSVGYGPTLGSSGALSSLIVQAERTSGASTLDWDVVYLIPADEMTHIEELGAALTTGVDGYAIDSVNEVVLPFAGDPFTTGNSVSRPAVRVVGGWPYLVPNQTNRMFVWMTFGGVTSTVTLAVHYWPRYLHVRPVSS